ncbi:MAG: type III pantothenate kinase [Eubacteriales bacterium]|nr:type III pantothenate kinase [Eubacteriales bacterium]
MVLAIDIGNTNIVIGCIGDDGTVFKERIYTDLKKTAVEYAISLKILLDLYSVDTSEITGGILSSSVPPVTPVMRRAAEKVICREMMVVGPGVKTGLDIKIDDPGQLGPDLAVGAVAGIAQYGAPLIVVDMGTATTVMVVNEKRQVIGGMIMPGVDVSLEGMSLRTSYLPKISVEPPKKLIGSNTIDCMKSGVIYGNAACIDGVVARIREEMQADMPAVATGGMANRIIPYCKEKIVIDDELSLKGLKLIYDRNMRQERKLLQK